MQRCNLPVVLDQLDLVDDPVECRAVTSSKGGDSTKHDISDEIRSDGNALDEQKRYNNFWIGVKKSIQLKKNQKCEVDKNLLKRFKKLESHKDDTVFPHDHPYHVRWDLFICALVVYSVIVIPFRIGFNSAVQGPTLIFDYLVTAAFFVDICVTFNTSYLDTKTDTNVVDRHRIAFRYLKGWFLVDLASTIPFDQIVGVFTASDSNLTAIRLVRMLRLFRLFKLSRLLKMDEVLDSVGLSPSAVSLLILMLQIFFIAHLYACFWHFITIPQALPGTFQHTWVTEFGYETDHEMSKYVAAFYYIIVTMLTVGYGDIHPTNDIERFYAIMTMLTGGIVFGALISKVAKLIEQRNPQARAFKMNMDELKAFMEEVHLSKTLKLKAKEAYGYYLNKKSSFGETGIVMELPKPILYQLVFQLYEREIKSIRIFHEYDCSFVIDLILHMRPFQAVKDEVIFAEGDVCNDIVVISRGSVRLSTSNGTKTIFAGICSDSNFFGDFEFYRNTTAIATYSAMKSCDLMSIHHSVFNKVIELSFDSGTKFMEDLKQRYDRFIEVSKKPVGKDIVKAVPRQSTFQRSYSMARHAAAIASLNGLNSGGAGRQRAFTEDAISPAGSPVKPARGSIGGGGIFRGNRAYTEDVNSPNASPNRGGPPRVKFNEDGEQEGGATRDPEHAVAPRNLINHQSAQSVGRSKGGMVNIEVVGGTPKLAAEKTISMRGNGVLWVDGQIEDAMKSQKILTTIEEEMNRAETATSIPSFRVVVFGSTGKKYVKERTQVYLDKRRILNPEGKYKASWDFFIGFWIIYSVLVVPVEIGFNQEAFAASNALNLAIDGLFAMDIVLSFRTAYHSVEDDALMISLPHIAKNYLKGWFPIDLISTVPFDEIVSAALGNSGSSLGFTKLVKIVRLLRLFKMARLLKLGHYVTKLEDYSGISPVVFDLLVILVEVFFIAHWVCCIWWGLTATFTKFTWFKDTDFVYRDLTLQPLHSRYLASLYWTFTTMTTVGYGDIYSVNTSEQLLNIFIILLGASLFGYMIANVSGLIGNFNQAESRRAERLTEITEYLSEKKCGTALSEKVLGHFKKQFNENSAFDEVNILNRLPHTISNQILIAQHQKKMSNIAIFNFIENQTVCLYLFQLMRPNFFDVDKFIIHEGNESTEIMFLVMGKATAYKKIVHRKKIGSDSRRRKSVNLLDDLKKDTSFKLHSDSQSKKSKGKNSGRKVKESAKSFLMSEDSSKSSKKITPPSQLEDDGGSPDKISARSRNSFLGTVFRSGRKTSESDVATPKQRVLVNDGDQLKMVTIELGPVERRRRRGVPKPGGGGGGGSVDGTNDGSGIRASASVESLTNLSRVSVESVTEGDRASVADGDRASVMDGGDRASQDSGGENKADEERLGFGTPYDRQPSSANIEFDRHNTKAGDFLDKSRSMFSDWNTFRDTEMAKEEEQRQQQRLSVDLPSLEKGTTAEMDDEEDESGSVNANKPPGAAASAASPEPFEAPRMQRSNSLFAAPFLRLRSDSLFQNNFFNDVESTESSSSSEYDSDKNSNDDEFFHEGKKNITADKMFKFMHHHNTLSAKKLNIGKDPTHGKDGQPIDPLDLKPFHTWTQTDMLKHNYIHIGILHPGDFVGHVAMMDRTVHRATVRATEHCTVYSMSKTEIGKLIRVEPTVAIKLQTALVEATRVQSNVLGKFHMRKQRANFLKKQVVVKFERKFREKTKGKSYASINAPQSRLAKVYKAIPLVPHDEDTAVVAEVERHKGAPGAGLVHKMVHNKHLFYDSDEEPKPISTSHKSVSFAERLHLTRSVSNIEALVSRSDTDVLARKKSSTALASEAQQNIAAPKRPRSLPLFINTEHASGKVPAPSVTPRTPTGAAGNRTPRSATDVLRRLSLFTRRSSTTSLIGATRKIRRHRSCPDLNMITEDELKPLKPYLEIFAGDTGNPRSGFKPSVVQIQARRQSFPSKDNDVWKYVHIHQGVV